MFKVVEVIREEGDAQAEKPPVKVTVERTDGPHGGSRFSVAFNAAGEIILHGAHVAEGDCGHERGWEDRR